MVLYEALIKYCAGASKKTIGILVDNLCVATLASAIAPALMALGAKVKVSYG